MKRLTYILAASLCFAAMASGLAAQDKSATPPPAASAPKPPVHTYRLFYTLSESDAGKKIGVQHYALTVNNDYRNSELKIGSKIPVTTGGYSKDGKFDPSQYQIQYVDVGLSISAQVIDVSNGQQLSTKVEQSSVVDGPGTSTAQPLIRQTLLSNMAVIQPGQTVALGSLDIPGSTRHLDIEVRMERVE